MKKLFTLLVINFLYIKSMAAGELAFTSFQSDNPDVFSFVTLIDLAPNTIVKFTDNGWLATGGFRGGEGITTWNSGASIISAGTVITITENNTASVGTSSGTMSLSTDGDQILAYSGTAASPKFITAINFDSAGWSDATSSNTSALPPGLTNGTNAINVGEIDNGQLNGSQTSTGSDAVISGSINTLSNWALNNSPQTPVSPTFTVNENTFPIEISRFQVRLSNGIPLLSWATANETGFSHFVVERAYDALSFEGIDKVFFTSSESQYEFKDLTAKGGQVYYRLKLVDLDNSFKYSRIISENISKADRVTFYPNPTSGALFVNMQVENIQIFNTSGMKIGRNGENSSIDLQNYPSGKYIVSGQTKEGYIFKKTIIKF